MDWDEKFMNAAKHFGGWSKCYSRQIGAVIVRDKTVIATGFNGPPRGVPPCDNLERLKEINRIIKTCNGGYPHLKIDTPEDCEKLKDKCPRKIISDKSGDLLFLCQAGHAERNALTNAAREGVVVKGAHMYCYSPKPCFECAKSIINAGITKVYYLDRVDYDNMSGWLFDQSGVQTIPIDQK
jgi:dCMP deaminase